MRPDRGRHARRRGVAVLALGAALTWSGVAAAQEGTRPDAATTADLEALYEARTDSARMRFVQADVDFMTGMIHHHAQAVVMGHLAPTHGASPAVQTLAARIINAQEDEIATMQRWLRDRGQLAPEVAIEGMTKTVRCPDSMMSANHADHAADAGKHPDGEADADVDVDAADHAAHAKHGAEPEADPTDDVEPADPTHVAGHMDMPGMLTPAQMEELARAQGSEFDRLFLTYMIQHHQGAVTMVHDLFGTDGAARDGATFKLASDIQVDQRTEIARMERMLSAMTAEGGAR